VASARNASGVFVNCQVGQDQGKMRGSTKSVSLGHDEACPSNLKREMHNHCEDGGRHFVGAQIFSPNDS
jgi:hypothetical protein